MKKKQIYKGKLLTRTKVKNNILHMYNLSDKSDRHDWYAEANSFCASLSSDYDLPITTTCGIVSALSPLKTWEQNKVCAKIFLDTGSGKHMQVFQSRQSRYYLVVAMSSVSRAYSKVERLFHSLRICCTLTKWSGLR